MKKNWDPYSAPYKEINSWWIKDLTVKDKIFRRQ